MTKKSADVIRLAIVGADRPYHSPRGGPPGGGGRTKSDDDPCPVTPLGDFDGSWHFLDTIGQKRVLSTRQLGNADELRGLFRGDESWLRRHFPERKVTDVDGEKKDRVIGFNKALAAAHMQQLCASQGLYDESVSLRRPGIWRGEDGLPIVHCGDQVLIEGNWQPSGTRTGNQIWIAASPTARPDIPAGQDVGREIQRQMADLWSFRTKGGEILVVGTLASGMLGTVARWRPNLFMCGPPGSGKSMLLETARDCCPMHRYTNNASEAGVISAMNGHVMPVFIDESSDRANQGGAEALMDLVLASSSGDGTKAVRGKADGGYREVSMAGSVVYGSVTPPPLQPQHMARISIVELDAPDAGEDNRAKMEALREWVKERAPSLWGRVIASAERWRASLDAFRMQLAVVGCAPREMDQFGAILAGWWILTNEGLPGDDGVREGVAAIAAFVRTAEDVKEDNNGHRALQVLLSRIVQYDGTTRQEQIGEMIIQIMTPSIDPADAHTLAKGLGIRGIRVIRPCLMRFGWGPLYPGGPDGWAPLPTPHPRADGGCTCLSCRDRQGRPVPRLSDDGGIWVMPKPAEPFFASERGLEGHRWQMELCRLPHVHKNRTNVRVYGPPGKAIWVPRALIDGGAWDG